MTEIADASQGLTRFTYDRNGNLLTVTDAKNQTTTYTYDSMDRLKTRTDALNRQETYGYDFAGNLTTFLDRKQQQTTFAYDALNRRTTATYPDATTTFTYDTVGRLTKASDTATGAGTIDLAYDVLDRLIQETTGQGTVTYQYDVLGRRIQMAANGQQPVSYGYDAASRLTQVAQGSLAVGLGYDAANRRISLTYPNGTNTSYTYDVASRVTDILHQGPGGIIDALTYQYDAAGNRTSLTRTNGTASLLPSAMTSASYDAANEQVAFAGATLTYDANGNLTNDGVNTYQWDARNRLISMSGGTTASFNYDALGRRTSKAVGSLTSQFLYDGNDIAAEIGGGAVGANYLRSLAIDEPFIRQTGTGNEFYHTDALGSTLTLSTSQGASATTYGYEPFGKTTVTGTSLNPFQFTGRENDGTGLVYYRARYYSPSRHRFIAEDPLGIVGFDPNSYAYVRNQPTFYIDPTGEIGKPTPLDSQHTYRLDNGRVDELNPSNINEWPNAHVYDKQGNPVGRAKLNPDGSVTTTHGDLTKGQLNRLKKPLRDALKKLRKRALSILDFAEILNLLRQIEKLGPGHCLTYDPISGDFSVGSCDDPNAT